MPSRLLSKCSLQVATVSERSRIMELEREVADLQLRLRASQQKEDAVSLSQQQISSLKAQAQSQEKKVWEKHSSMSYTWPVAARYAVLVKYTI